MDRSEECWITGIFHASDAQEMGDPCKNVIGSQDGITQLYKIERNNYESFVIF